MNPLPRAVIDAITAAFPGAVNIRLRRAIARQVRMGLPLGDLAQRHATDEQGRLLLAALQAQIDTLKE
jgi:hypothetical protein